MDTLVKTKKKKKDEEGFDEERRKKIRVYSPIIHNNRPQISATVIN